MGGSCENAGPPPLVPTNDKINRKCSANSVNSSFSDIFQVDGNDNSENLSISDRAPISLTPAKKPNKRTLKILQASSLPLVSVFNARSLYNKPDSFSTLLHELGIKTAIVSESWEREDHSLENLLQLNDYKIHSYKRPKIKANRQPGGGCAIIYNERRFKATKLDVFVPEV